MTMLDPSKDGWKPRTLPGFFGVVGPLWTKKEPAGWAYGLLAEGRHLNPAGIVHGGMLCTLLDHALSTIAWEANARKPCVTIAFDVQFVASAKAADFVVCRGEIVRLTATLTFLRGTLTVSEESIATASAVVKRL